MIIPKKIFRRPPIIYPQSIIINKNNLKIDDFSQIDDFAFINCGKSTVLGKFVHIASFCSVIGGGEFKMGDFSGLSAGCRIITGSDSFSGLALTNPTVPSEYTKVSVGAISIGRHAILGTNVTVLPGVIIGEGAAVGAGAIVRHNLDPWTIYAGFDCKRIKRRPSETILRLEKELMERVTEK